MNPYYKNIVKLLLDTLPFVFSDGTFVLKGGTAINLFYRNLPRLSVDIDLAYAERKHDRETALENITGRLSKISAELKKYGMDTDRTRFEADTTKLVVTRGSYRVKLEVNHVFRGILKPPKKITVSPNVEKMFMSAPEAYVMDHDELYAGKIMAALNRQHPRDLFDVKKLYENGGITDEIIDCFVCYLCGGNGVFYETLDPNPKDIRDVFAKDFDGMQFERTTPEELTEIFLRLKRDVVGMMRNERKDFLVGFSRAVPDFSLAPFPELSEYPAIKWKLLNLEKFGKKSPAEFALQAKKLEDLFSM